MVALLASCGKMEEKTENMVEPVAKEVTVTELWTMVEAEDTKVMETASGDVVVEETEAMADTATGIAK